MFRYKTKCHGQVNPYAEGMPRLWNDTIDAHRRDVQAAVLDATWQLVSEQGLLSVTMSDIAERAGIGRATLYKYYSSVESILNAHHERHVSSHLNELTALKDQPGAPMTRLERVLTAYAFICHHRGRHGTQDLSALLHKGDHVQKAEAQIRNLFRDLIEHAAAERAVRADASPAELADFCVHALAAAGSLRSHAATRRLVAITVDGLRG